MSLTLKREPDTRPEQDFWYVHDDATGKLIEQIYRDTPGNLAGLKENWFWGLSHPYERRSDQIHYGSKQTRYEATAAFKARWLLSNPE